jgi:hypothetical protein
LVNEGLLQGEGNNRMNPDGTMTRAMLVTMLYRMAGEPAVGKNPFSDVSQGMWFTDAITWAAEIGVVNGVGGGRFAPNRSITREQVATILFRYGKLEQGIYRDRGWLGIFSDGDQVSDYAEDSLRYLIAQGVVNGKGEKLDPQGAATRGEVATMLWRWMEYCNG